MRHQLANVTNDATVWLRSVRLPEEAHVQADATEEVEDPSDELIRVSLTSNFLKAMSAAEFGLKVGDVGSIGLAQELLAKGTRIAQEWNHPLFWWSHLIARHLIHDLWAHSLHKLLPEIDGDSNWNAMRRRFLIMLSLRDVSEVELWPSQEEAAARAINESDDLVVSMPTSAGKTRVAELAILRALSLGKRVVYVTPLRALSAQVERTLRRTFGPLNIRVSSMYGASGATNYDRSSLRNDSIVIATPEKLDFALRSEPKLLDDVGLVIFDEGHMIGMEEREVRYEVLVQRLLRRPDSVGRR
ncbi:DEAD/DEAH box helicase, partial [Myxococcota bacterium]|nr:DEAD/DEAH box helicase [Myxococcota bacterium]